MEVTELTLSDMEHTIRAHHVMACAGLFAVVCLGLWFFLLVRSATPVLWNTCEDPECEMARQELQNTISPFVDPCQDFYHHVCSRKWPDATRQKTTDFLESAVVNQLGTASWRLRGIEPETGSQSLQVLATFHRVCTNFMRSTRLTLGEIVRPLEEEADLLKLTNFSTVLGRIVTLTLARGIDTIFGLRLVKHTFSEEMCLCLLNGETIANKLGEQNHTENLKYYLQSVLDEIFSKDASARDSLKHILELDSRVFSQLASVEPPVELTMSSLGQLTSALNTAGWLKLINTLLVDNKRLTYNTLLFAEDMTALKKVVGIFKDITTYGLLYLYVHILADVLRFDYQRRFGVSTSLSIGTKACFRAGQDVVTRPWAGLFVSMSDRSAQEARVISTFKLIHPTVAHPYRFAWMEPSSKWKTIGAIGRLDVFPLLSIIRQPSELEQQNRVQAINLSGDFPDLFLRLKASEKLALLKEPPRINDLLMNRLLLEGKVAYSSRLSSIVVPTAMSQQPISYPEKVPLEYNLGTLGALMIKEISRIILPRPEQRATAESPQLSKYLGELLSCANSTARSVLNVSLVSEPVRTVSEELFVWMRSARIAYDTLKHTLRRYRNRKNWAVVWKEAQRTFFRRFCLLSCGSGQPRDPLTPEARCVLPLVNMAEFSEVFECPPSSNMNVGTRCAAL
ncbi:unnamed protein product [Ixodes hexagonus]